MTRTMLIASAPELPVAVGDQLAGELSERLGQDGWEVQVDDDLVAADVGELVDAARDARDRTGAAFAICLTDVPLRTDRRPLVAALDAEQGIGVVSVPAGGAVRQRRNVERAAEAVVAELVDQEAPSPGQPLELPQRHRLRHGFALSPVLGHARLLAGMVRANRPWRALGTLSSAVVAALATGAYAVINSTVWQLSEALSPLRLLAIMVVALGAVVGWLVVAHGLWERGGDGRAAKDRRLYNAATLLTLTIAVAWAYVLLLAVLLAVSALLIDSGVMRSMTGRQAGPAEYLQLAWLGASIATVAGALGSGLESLDDVRSAAYGHHQRHRRPDEHKG
jgi:hypothetical protein